MILQKIHHFDNFQSINLIFLIKWYFLNHHNVILYPFKYIFVNDFIVYLLQLQLYYQELLLHQKIVLI